MLNGLKLNKTMKNLNTFEQHINESQTEPNRVTREHFYGLKGKDIDSHKWESLSTDEMKSIEILYDHIKPKGTGHISHNQGSYEDNVIRIMQIDGGYPLIKIGKHSNSPQIWTLVTQEDTTDTLYLDCRYYIFPDLASLMGFVAAKFGPSLEWAKIK